MLQTKTVISATRTTNPIQCWRLQIATQQVMTLVICNTIRTRRTFPSRPSSQESIPGAGRALGDVAGYTELNEAMIDDPWNPFSLEADFNLASWLVRSKVSKSQINAYFVEGLGGMNARSFRSAYTLQQHLDVLDPFGEYLTWTEGAIGDGRHTTTFYHRNALDCVRYLVRQVA